MDPHEIRTWIIFYLISFVVLLLALFFTTEGALLGVGLTLVIVVVGLNLLLISNEIKKMTHKKELMKKLSRSGREREGEDIDDIRLPAR